MGRPLIMGRRTFMSLGKPLDGRDNIVVSRDRYFKPDGAFVFATLDGAVAKARSCAQARGVDEIMVIGGADIYSQILPAADRLYWTQVGANVDGDTSFPDFDRSAWRESSREPIPKGPKDDYEAVLVTLDRT